MRLESKEKKIAVLSIIVLLATFILIYIFYINTKGKDIAEQANKINQKNAEEASQKAQETGALSQTGNGLVDDIVNSDTNSGTNLSGSNTTGSNQSGNAARKEEQELAFLDSDTKLTTGSKILTGNKNTSEPAKTETTKKENQETKNNTGDIKMLKGTEIYNSKLEILTQLDLKYDYILKDDQNNYFIRLSKNFGNINDSVKKIGGNTVEILDKNIINENMLFGDKVVYLNLTQYYKKKVFILAKFEKLNEYRLIQVDFDKYYKSKEYLKSLFIF